MVNGYSPETMLAKERARREMEQVYTEALASLNIVAGRPGRKSAPSINDYRRAQAAMQRVIDVLEVQYISV